MSVRYTATWYDVVQARQQDTHTTHRHTSIAVTAGTAGTPVSKWRAVCCDLHFAAADCIPIVGSAKSLVLNDKRFNHTKVWCTFIFIDLQAS